MTTKTDEFNIEVLADGIARAIATSKTCAYSALYVTKGKKLNRCNVCLTALEKFLKSIRGRHNHYINHIRGLIRIRKECHEFGLNIPSCLLDMIPNFSEILPLFLLSEIEKMVDKFNKTKCKHRRFVDIINITQRIDKYLAILINYGIKHPAVTQMQSIAMDLNMIYVFAGALYNPCIVTGFAAKESVSTPPRAG